MKPRVFASLELFPRIAALIPGMDELDIAYSCARAGASGIVVSMPTDSVNRESLAHFDRPGLPLLCVHAPIYQLDRVTGLGSAPDRFLVSDDGRPCSKFDEIEDLQARISGTHQEVAILIEPDPQIIKRALKTRAKWVAFSTNTLIQSESSHDASQELARLRSAIILASRNSLRVMLYGSIDRHLAPSIITLEGVEELIPTDTLWALAIRHGWEGALETFNQWL